MAEQDKKEQKLNVEDALSLSEAYLIKNRKGIIGGIVAVIIIIAAFFAYKYLYLAPREEKAEIAIFKGEEYFGQDAYEVALNGDSVSYKGFIKIANEFSGTKTANLAKAYAGICYAQLGKYNEAQKFLSDFDGNDQMVSPAILGALGNCYAQLNQLDKAVTTLQDAAKKADNNTLSPIYLLQAGLIMEQQGKYTDAIAAYTTIKDKYFNSYQAMDIDKYIERATALKK
jgi:hypothetical protein